jgi:type I restriction enzyme S subunit
MRAGWQTKTLGELTDVFADGDWVESKDQSREGIRLIQTGNVGEGVFKDRAEKARYISEDTFKRLRCTEIIEGDCLISRLPDPVGRSCILPDTGEKMITAVDCTIVRFNSKQIIPTFFNFYSQSTDYLESVQAETTGTTRNRISRSKLGQIAIPVPPLPEQHRIVNILDESFDGIATAKANAEKNLQNSHALFESHLQSVFTQRGEGWVDAEIGECIRFIDYRGKTPQKTEGGLRLITAKNVKMGYVQDEPREFVAPKSYDDWMTRGIPKLGDVLFTTEAPLANVAQLDTDDKVVFAQRIIIMQPDASKLDSTFLKYLLLSQPVQQRIHAKGTGATVKGIKASLLKTIELSFPKIIAEQRQIVAKLNSLRDETQRLESIYKQKLNALDDLKKSLLHQAFSGEL